MERMEKKRSISEISATGAGSQVPVSNASGEFVMTDYDADGLPYDSSNSVKDILDDKQDITLATPIVVDGTTYTEVETALNAINDKAVSITVDNAMSSTSENPVQNKVITSALSGKADTSSLATVATTGAYSDLSGTPTLGTASALDVATSGDASTSEVVKGDDSRLTDARNAADVYSWAKASTKPSYTASEVGAVATTAVGSANGVAELDSTGKVPSSQLPSYVDDVLEYDSTSQFPATGEDGKIYIAKDTNKTYRWSGTTYVEISESLALGETSSTAYAGNKGKANADAIAAIKDGTNIDSFSDVETALDGKANVEIIYTYGDTWNDKSWGASAPFDGYNIWSDGDNIYYSNNTVHYVLNKSTNIWETKTWTGLTDYTGADVWTDGDNIYYSSGNKQYVLDKSTSTWSTKTWLGRTNFSGSTIWTDGTNIYCSMESSTIQYVLDKTTSTWSNAPWYGNNNINGAKIWTDGTDIYMSNSSNQYVLNKSTSTWSTKTWTGLTSFNGHCVWSDGTNIYMSDSSSQYVLNKDTSTWTQKTWTGLTSFYGYDTWTYNDNIYCAGTKELSKIASRNKIIENSIIVKSNGDLQGAAEIYDNAGNALSDKYDATSLTFPNERFTITASSWSSSQTGGYYTYTLSTGNTKYNTYSDVTMTNVGSTDSADATSAEKAAYALVNKFDAADGTGVNSFTLYAKTKPTTTFYIKLSGQYMAKNAASSSKALDITTGCNLTAKSSRMTSAITTISKAFNGGAERTIEFVDDIVGISASSWSSTTNPLGYYTLTTTLHTPITSYIRPDVSLMGNSTFEGNYIPSAAQIAAYNLVDFFEVYDGESATTLKVYAKTKPTTDFYVNISGVYIA